MQVPVLVPFSVCYLLLIYIQSSEACKGCINLDEFSFAKIRPKFKAILAKFDVPYPYGDKQEAFEKAAEDVVNLKELVFAQIGIKDYGEKENENFGKKFDINSKSDLPQILLFIEGKDEPIKFKEETWTADSIKTFVRQNGIYVGLAGCLQEFDKLAEDFINSEDKDDKLKKAEETASKLGEDEKNIADTYLKFMKKVLEQGVEFIHKEKARLTKLLADAKMHIQKKQQLSHRLNVLHSFNLQDGLKDEL